MSQEFKTTSKGTQLPLLKLKGKNYLQVAHRLVWYREDHPNGIIKTQILSQQDGEVVVKAEIYSMTAQGPVPLASAHKMETKANFADYIEKAETGAIGRALAMVGYGTQFEPEFDEGNRLADSPIDVATRAGATSLNGANGTSSGGSSATTTASVTSIPSFRKKKVEATVATTTTTDEL